MKRSLTPFAAAIVSGSLLLSSTPAFAETATNERCLRVTGREQTRCININNQTRVRLRAATLVTKTRAKLRRSERVEERKKIPDNILDRVEGLNLNKTRMNNANAGSNRRQLQDAIKTAQDKCRSLMGMRRAACMRESFRVGTN